MQVFCSYTSKSNLFSAIVSECEEKNELSTPEKNELSTDYKNF